MIGTDTRLSGVVALTDGIETAFEALKADKKLDRHVSGSYRATQPLELSLTREADNQIDANAIRLDYEGQALGYLPKALASEVAPLLDKNTRFTAHLTEIKPYYDWRAKKQRYSVETRLEWLTQPGRAPNTRLWPTVMDGFERARLKELDKIATIIPERIDTFEAGGKTITQRFDQERGEKSYYLSGHLIARGKDDPLKETAPDFARDNLPDAVRDEITRRLNTII